MIVADSSVLIALSKIGRLRLLESLYKTVTFGPVVKLEVVDHGRAINAPEVKQVEIGLKEQWIREARPTGREKSLMLRLLENAKLDEGEAESIAIADIRKLTIAIDDKEARLVADAMGIEYLGTAGILLAAFKDKHISYDELGKTVRDLGRVLWLSPDVVAEILRVASEETR